MPNDTARLVEAFGKVARTLSRAEGGHAANGMVLTPAAREARVALKEIAEAWPVLGEIRQLNEERAAILAELEDRK